MTPHIDAQYNKINAIVSEKPFGSKCDSKNYENMFHGFAAARADLNNEENKKECVPNPIIDRRRRQLILFCASQIRRYIREAGDVLQQHLVIHTEAQQKAEDERDKETCIINL